MGDFTITATAECDYCGNLLGASDEECDECNSSDRKTQMFRKIRANPEDIETIAIEATYQHKWYKLADELGEDWIGYEWLGPQESVRNMVRSAAWDTINDIPKRGMSTDAPNDVEVS